MQIESFKIFCDLTETESFTRAAEISGITQSAVSQQISSLERVFNCLLIERSKKRFRLTREGTLLYESSKNIIQSYDALHSRLQEAQGVISGSIRVATIYSVGLYGLPAYLKTFLKAHPAVNVHVEYQRFNQVYDDLLGNIVDLGLVAYPGRDARVEMIEVWREPMVLICHPTHPLAKQKKLEFAALQDQRFVAFDSDTPTRRALDRLFREDGVTVNTGMEFDNIETVKRAVEIDVGVSIVPESAVAQEVSKGTLVALRFANKQIERPVAVIYKKSKVLNPAIKQFVELLQGKPVRAKGEKAAKAA